MNRKSYALYRMVASPMALSDLNHPQITLILRFLLLRISGMDEA